MPTKNKKKSKGKGKQKKGSGKEKHGQSKAATADSGEKVVAANPRFQEYERDINGLLASCLEEHEKCGGRLSARWWEAGLKRLTENSEEARMAGRKGLEEVMDGLFNYYVVRLCQASGKVEEEIVLNTLRRLIDADSRRPLRMLDFVELERGKEGEQTYAIYRDVPIAYHEDITFPCSACGVNGNGRLVCGGCEVTRYCNMDCKVSDRRAHRAVCEAKRRERQIFALEVKAEKLRQMLSKATSETNLFAPPPPRDDCPVCMLPLPFSDETGSHAVYFQCCGKRICNGCVFENRRIILKSGRSHTCPFCRKPEPHSVEEILRLTKKRMDGGDARAFFNMSLDFLNGRLGLPYDEIRSFDLMLKAAELGSADACYMVGKFFEKGRMVEVDHFTAKRFFEIAAKKGDLLARHKLGVFESDEGDEDTAFQHWRMAARGGCKQSMLAMEFGRDMGIISESEYAEVYQVFTEIHEEISSKERDECPNVYF